ncbi:GTP-binding protein 10-like, partial [Oppia nitens]|uniref:GTP-binding protein 10-like n=1 Tax=Oppia nitens TaxID=1686743 RepID=UPI0023DA8183
MSVITNTTFKCLLPIGRHLNGQSIRCYDSTVPPIRVFVKDRFKHFVDSLRIKVTGGPGGHGLPKFGGIGGKGGNVFVEAVDGIKLKKINEKIKQFKGQSGENSAHYRVIGKDGADCVIKAPVGVTIINEMGRKLGELDKVGDKVLVALGGPGGNVKNNFCGLKGQKQIITLDLKLIADCGFVGFPNAGKSSLLKAISRASPKIANYPFTTINPNIGVMQFDDMRQISVADLPGLVEGAHINIGLGHKFLKHIVRTKLLVFVIDINGFTFRPEWPQRTPLDTYLLLNRELELFDDTLLNKPAILVVSKIDNKKCIENYEIFVDQLKDFKENNSKNLINDMKSNKFIHFDKIIGVCSKNGYNIPELRDIIRNIIDYNC